jgi:hypothetical protein
LFSGYCYEFPREYVRSIGELQRYLDRTVSLAASTSWENVVEGKLCRFTALQGEGAKAGFGRRNKDGVVGAVKEDKTAGGSIPFDF